jgi:DnaJ-domain-containing protein 1
MVDYFSLLNEPRRPWLDPDALKQKFISLSNESHPDRVHNASPAVKDDAQLRSTSLNAAYRCLRDPKDRLRHLLELELGAKPKDIQSIPQDLMDLCLEVSQLCRQTDTFLAEKHAATSPLVHVQIFERSQDWTEKLMVLQKRLNSRREDLEAELKGIDAGWVNIQGPRAPARSTTLQRLEQMYRLFSYFARWGGQLQERIVQLAF